MRGFAWILPALLCLGSCTGAPEGVQPVGDFELERYLGQWYEIARLDHSFERGLSHVTATYTRSGDGSLQVLNRGYARTEGQWREARGRARMAGPADVGQLEVSFFGPFYSGYNIIALDREAYQWALVSGYSRDYLWLLSRRPELEADVRERLLERARDLGFAVRQLIWVEHGPLPATAGP